MMSLLNSEMVKMPNNRNSAKEKKLVNDWSYFKPIGPHVGDDPENAIENLKEMHPSDVERLLEIGDEMAEYIGQL